MTISQDEDMPRNPDRIEAALKVARIADEGIRLSSGGYLTRDGDVDR
ncbi:MAG: hypothetical protein H0U72_05870 [Nitrosospira sp.]|nr:hypothetical protein [Nitrosospira sp.]